MNVHTLKLKTIISMFLVKIPGRSVLDGAWVSKF